MAALEAEGLPSWVQHFDIVQVCMIMMISIISWFTIRAFNDISKNTSELFSRIKELEDGFHELKGEHAVLCRRNKV
jgi:hypothetical protein